MEGSPGRVLALAVSMEQSAIRMYERAALLLTGDAAACARALLKDEQKHLGDFLAMLGKVHCKGDSPMSGLLLAAQGDTLLFPGGLTQAAREGAFSSEEALLKAAIDAEDRSCRFYLEAASKEALSPEESKIFHQISAQEAEHKQIWEARLEQLLSTQKCGKPME